MLVEVYYEIKKSSGLPEIIPLKANLRSAKEVAVDHFMKMEHRTTVEVTFDDGGTKRWTIGPLTGSQIQSKPSQIRKGKKFANLEYWFFSFFSRNTEKSMWTEEELVEVGSEEDFRSKILNTMNDLEKKVDSDVQKAPKRPPLEIPQKMDNAKKALSIAFRKLIGDINKSRKKESLPLEKLRPEILAIKDTLELIRLAREEFGEEMNEGLRVLRIEFSRVIGEINRLEKKESLSKLHSELHSEILAIKEALELIRLAREEFGEEINEIGKDLDLKGEKE